jgi:hypothetical protein
MRVIKLLSLCVLMSLISARPASAWFEWLDYLSGPGGFWGGRVDVRMWCAGDETQRARLQREFIAALRDAQRINNAEAWRLLASRIQSINDDVLAVSAADIQKLLQKANGISDSDFTAFRALFAAPYPARKRFERPSDKEPANNLVETADLVQLMIDRVYHMDVEVSATAIFISLCSPDIDRTWAFELGSSVMGARSNPAYAGDKAIGLLTYTAAVTYRLRSRPGGDTVDLGLQGGEYTFWSGGFDTFHGVLLEPFADVHFPSTWASGSGQRRARWSRLSARVGLVFFPQGFDTSQFGASPGTVRHISGAEPTLTATVYYRIK